MGVYIGDDFIWSPTGHVVPGSLRVYINGEVIHPEEETESPEDPQPTEPTDQGPEEK